MRTNSFAPDALIRYSPSSITMTRGSAALAARWLAALSAATACPGTFLSSFAILRLFMITNRANLAAKLPCYYSMTAEPTIV
jgi:hypothetical protein